LGHTLPGTSLSTTLAKFFNPASVLSFSHLAKYEFREIKDLDVDTVTKYAKRITAYYAVHDRWVPQFAREQIIRIINQNGGDAIICNEGFPHAFSLGILSLLYADLSSWTPDGEKDFVVDINSVPSDYRISGD
jgi:hypothetical protein